MSSRQSYLLFPIGLVFSSRIAMVDHEVMHMLRKQASTWQLADILESSIERAEKETEFHN